MAWERLLFSCRRSIREAQFFNRRFAIWFDGSWKAAAPSLPFGRRFDSLAGNRVARAASMTAQAQAIIAEGQADLIFTARQALRDPYFPVHAARELGQANAVHLPPQYLRA